MGNKLNVADNSRKLENATKGMYSKIKGSGGSRKSSQITGLDIIDGKVGGKIPVDEFIQLRKTSVHNIEGDSLTLGRYNADGKSYITEAQKSNSSYFDLGDDWGEIQTRYNLTNDEMFEYLNIPALDDAVTKGKQIRFSHNPTIRAYEKTYLYQEWMYLKEKHGFTDLIKEGEIWYAVK